MQIIHGLRKTQFYEEWSTWKTKLAQTLAFGCLFPTLSDTTTHFHFQRYLSYLEIAYLVYISFWVPRIGIWEPLILILVSCRKNQIHHLHRNKNKGPNHSTLEMHKQWRNPFPVLWRGTYEHLHQWFPTGAPQHTKVPWDSARGVANNCKSLIFRRPILPSWGAAKYW